jgi:uncharacterized protein (DUF2235 family)
VAHRFRSISWLNSRDFHPPFKERIMPRNILIFADGTGQCGGLFPDEVISNIYKLYRSCRCGPDSAIDPALQLAFYDPGLGSQNDGGRIKIGFARRIYNALSQSTGLGITDNIINCYAAILQLWRPGDRIYLFGFSRGAYTIRCVGGVLALCGVPTTQKDGTPLTYSPCNLRAIATEAVKHVYQYGASIKGDPFKELREERAAQFRRKYGSDDKGLANQYPYFISVFETVASLGLTPAVRKTLAAITAVAVCGWSAAVAGMAASTFFGFWAVFAGHVGTASLVLLAAYLCTHLRYHPGKKRFYLSRWAMHFYDDKLNPHVRYARHALAIDEKREDFDYVPWVYDGDVRQRGSDEPELLKQIWFAGCHTDIGGGYEENAARLSDTSLNWMIEQLREVPDSPVQIDERVLKRFPEATGPQHDETRKPFPGIWGKLGFKWSIKRRNIAHDALLHPSVLERFAAPAVLDYDTEQPYRPEPLRHHILVKNYYETV